jgi:putative lipoic acid-binding regulatory protein
MLTGPALIHLTAEELQSAAQFEAHTATLVATMANAGVYLALTIALIVESIEIIGTLYRLLVKSRQPFPAKA